MKVSNIFKGDKVLWMVFFFLCLISIIEVFSASSGLTYKSQDYVGPIIYHTGTIVFGFIVAIVIVHIPWRYFKLMTPFLLLFSIVTLLWVLLAGTKIGDAGRWINLFGFTFQPSEIAKGSLVLAVAQILSIMQDEDGADPKAIKYILVLSIPIIFLIFLENFSTAALLSIVIYLMMILGRVPMKQIGILTGIGLGVMILGLAFIWFAGHDKDELERMEKQQKIEMVAGVKKEKSFLDKVFHRADTWKSRLMKFTDDKEVAPEDYDLDKDAQVAHANIAIASSNVLGKGPGNSEQRDFLAQAFSDFIFAIIIEEMGFVGSGLVVLLYIFLLFRAARIA
ncbi:MAG: FtsW/RodA/SpoVE family cell cycle protein, partial [Prevotella sp.]|nr:FtsW/RodA/SpoVE family cell cycle protein [Prevotella sp.]